MIHVYALTDAGAAVPEQLSGIDDRLLELRVAGPAAAVLSRHDEAPEPTAEALLRHAAVVEALQRHGAVLPARFGTGLTDETAVDELLAEPGLAKRLDRVRDRVEVDVRLVATAASTASPLSGSSVAADRPADPNTTGSCGGSRSAVARTGSEHLRALAARAATRGSSEQVRQAALEAVRTRVESAAVELVDRPPGSPRVLRHTALLLDRAALPAFAATVADLAAELAPAHTVLCTGPWPPYNFVEVAP